MSRTVCAFVMLLGACGVSPPVAGVALPSSPAGCPLPSGRLCDLELGCICDDGCNECAFVDVYCQGFRMTDIGCLSPPLHCASAADCPQGSLCAFDPGCASPAGICVVSHSDYGHRVITICDCDDETVEVEIERYVTQPYSHVGGCLISPTARAAPRATRRRGS